MPTSIQNLNFVAIRNLFRSLRDYGLNPYEWQIDREPATPTPPGADTIEFHHRYDRNFRMNGQINRTDAKGFEVEELRVVSI